MESTPRRTQGLRSGDRATRVLAAVQSAAVAELTQQGFASFSMDRVAKAAGVNRTTVYRRWPSKADLLRFVIRPLLEKYEAPAITDSPRSDLVDLLRTIRDTSDLPLGRAFTEATRVAPDELSELTSEVASTALAPFRMVMKRAGDAGLIDPTSVEPRAHLAFFGIVMWTQTHQSPASDEDCRTFGRVLIP